MKHCLSAGICLNNRRYDIQHITLCIVKGLEFLCLVRYVTWYFSQLQTDGIDYDYFYHGSIAFIFSIVFALNLYIVISCVYIYTREHLAA